MSVKLKKKTLTGILVALLLVAVVAVSAQVYPIRWDQQLEEPDPAAAAVGSGAVGIGDGGIALFPDVISARGAAGTAAGNALVQVYPDASCSAANRGEIRAGVIENVLVQSPPDSTDVDALCMCRKKVVKSAAPVDTVTYAWMCFNSSNLGSA